MKTHHRFIYVGTALLAVGLALAASQASAAGHRLGVGARYHTEHSVFDDLPFDDDLGVGAVYQYHDDVAYWELALDYVPDPSSATTDYTLTPQLSLLVKDNVWRGGLGAAATYIKDDLVDDEWTDIYWQFQLGASIPVGRFSVDLMAYYVFEDWDDVMDFEWDDLEAGAWLTYPF